ncbi:MAG TPA: serine hydrolase domain-containing protein [Thermoanaerobaculia bacterium]|jgi:CubicO group peptidase (beta-lactamase class C family)|nr:serine hydrolase domain-containing protein [Thermoanaerobaculia bacterium]
MPSLIAVLLLAAASQSPQSDLAARIDAMLNDAIRSGPAAGASIAVVKGGRTIIASGYGFANVELEARATANTVYHIDSITKHLTAAAILQLADQKKLSLDDAVGTYIPRLPASWKNVRIRHLLSHTSGSESYTSLPSWGPQERLDMSHDAIVDLVREAPFHFEPGASWRYNNTGFYLLGMVIEKVTGQPYAEAMQQRVFAPLGMDATRYCGFRSVVSQRASGYEVDHGKVVNAEPMSWDAPFAGGGLCSTVLDLVRFERAIEDHRLFSDSMLKMMRTPSTLSDGLSVDYGFGTRLGNLGGHRIVGHTGNGGGFRNIFERFPDDDLTIVVLTNADGGAVRPAMIATRIARLVLGIPEEPMRDLPLSAADAAPFLGTFESDEGTVTNVPREGGIGFRPGTAGPLIPLHYQGGTTFAITPDERVTMMMKDGKAELGALYVGGLFADASRRVK